jgi:hypothetical protein
MLVAHAYNTVILAIWEMRSGSLQFKTALQKVCAPDYFHQVRVTGQVPEAVPVFVSLTGTSIGQYLTGACAYLA